MKFRKGQMVRCVNDGFNNRPPAYKVTIGAVYTVEDTYQCPVCNSEQNILFEFPLHTSMGCRCPNTTYMRQTFYAWRFEPVEDSEYEPEVSEDALFAS